MVTAINQGRRSQGETWLHAGSCLDGPDFKRSRGFAVCRAAAVTRRHAGAGGSRDAVDRRRQPLYRGPLLGEIPPVSHGFDDWLLLQRTRVAEVIAEMLRRIAAAAHIVSDDFSCGSSNGRKSRRVGSVGCSDGTATHRMSGKVRVQRDFCHCERSNSVVASAAKQHPEESTRCTSCQPREIASLRQQEASRHGRARPGPYA